MGEISTCLTKAKHNKALNIYTYLLRLLFIFMQYFDGLVQEKRNSQWSYIFLALTYQFGLELASAYFIYRKCLLFLLYML